METFVVHVIGGIEDMIEMLCAHIESAGRNPGGHL